MKTLFNWLLSLFVFGWFVYWYFIQNHHLSRRDMEIWFVAFLMWVGVQYVVMKSKKSKHEKEQL